MNQTRIDFLNKRKLELLRIEKEQGFLWNKERWELQYIERCLKTICKKQNEKVIAS